MRIAAIVLGFVDFPFQFSDGVVGQPWHIGKLGDGNKSRHDGVTEEEFFERKPAVRRLVKPAINEEDCGRRIERSCDRGDDYAGILWKGVRKLEAGDKYINVPPSESSTLATR